MNDEQDEKRAPEIQMNPERCRFIKKTQCQRHDNTGACDAKPADHEEDRTYPEQDRYGSPYPYHLFHHEHSTHSRLVVVIIFLNVHVQFPLRISHIFVHGLFL